MSNQAKISVTFYFGPSDEPSDTLTKNYILNHWADEASLRRLLDEVAKELNYISGFGIRSIRVQSDQLSFIVDYSRQFKPCREEDGYLSFWDVLRFEVGRYTGWHGGGAVRVEIPRARFREGDNGLKIRPITVGSRKKVRQYGTLYHLTYDHTDPVLVSFWQKLKEGAFAPDVKKKWDHVGAVDIISWWELPQAQTTQHRWGKARERREAEEKKKKKLERAGIVYKDKKQRAKAHQVYIIAAKGEGLSGVYKIGISNAPGKRLQSLNTSNPFELEIVHKFVAEPAKEAESRLHAMFADCRVSREWFRLTGEQLAELKQITGFKGGEFSRGTET